MSQAHNRVKREQIVTLRQEGNSLKEISEILFISYNSVLKIHKSYLNLGTLGLEPQYKNCDLATPCIRTLQRWYRKEGLIRPNRQTAEPSIGKSRAVHNIWQVDAKENLVLADGTAACYLTMVDEKSGAWLAAPVFPPQED